MTEDLRNPPTGQRVRLDGGTHRSLGVLVNVGAADATDDRRDQNLAPDRGRRCGDILEADVPGGVEAECVHATILPVDW